MEVDGFGGFPSDVEPCHWTGKLPFRIIGPSAPQFMAIIVMLSHYRLLIVRGSRRSDRHGRKATNNVMAEVRRRRRNRRECLFSRAKLENLIAPIRPLYTGRRAFCLYYRYRRAFNRFPYTR